MNIASHVLGHEGENSLCSYLMKEDLITELTTYNDDKISSITYFAISLNLTDKGLEKYERVIEIVMKMIHNLQLEGPVDHMFYETSRNNEIRWQFLDKMAGCNFTVMVAQNMNVYDDEMMEDILSSKYLFKGFNKEEYQKVLNGFVPKHLCIYLTTQQEDHFKDKEILKVKHYGTEYVKEKFSDSLLNLMTNPDVPTSEHMKLSNPPPNTFFPKSLDILPENLEESKTVRNIYSDERVDLFYKKSDKFKNPKVNVMSLFYTNDCGIAVNCEGFTFVSLYLQVLTDYLREFTYTAEMASMKFEYGYMDGSLRFNFTGYSDSIGEFINKCFEKLSNFNAEEWQQSFESRKSNIIKAYNNLYLSDPYMQVYHYLQSVIVNLTFTNDQNLREAEDFTFERFVELSKKMFKNGRSVWFFNGNLTQDEVKKVCIEAVDTLGFKSIPKDLLMQDRVIALQDSTEVSVEFDALQKEESNSALISLYMDAPKRDIEHGMLIETIYQALGQPAFDFLRTKEQLGYVAMCRLFCYRGILGGGFLIQSSDKSCEYIISKTREFLNIQKEKIQNLTNEEYETAVNAVIMLKKEVDLSLLAESVRLFREIERHTYDFEIKEKQIEHLSKMIDSSNQEFYNESKQKIVSLFNKMFFENIKLVNVKHNSSKHKEENDEFFEKNKEVLNATRSRIGLSEVGKFKNSQSMYPDQLLTKFAQERYKSS